MPVTEEPATQPNVAAEEVRPIARARVRSELHCSVIALLVQILIAQFFDF